VPIVGHPHPELPDRRRHRRRAVGEPAVESEVDVQAVAGVEVVQQVLADRLGVGHRVPGQPGRTGLEPALRAAHRHPPSGEQLAMAGGEAVDRMSLWHSGRVSSAGSVMPTADSPTGESLGDQRGWGEAEGDPNVR
jgi:hypothetical protein